MAKQVYWLAGIVAIVLGITTVFLEVNRSIDKRTITELFKLSLKLKLGKLI
ncbi:hypothetical protein ACS126_01920 [Sphingobacterium lactis]|uniref:hypothetical protein n=1 Tax=Sphingobacterium lactis TaxID=797291 RepID=UPI003EC5ABB0